MRAFIMACFAVAVIAIGAAFMLGHFQKPADAAFHSTAVRLPHG